MTKEQFKQNIEKKKYFDAFISIIENAITLEVTTFVEDIQDPEADRIHYPKGKPGERILTKIDLLDGDITNIIGSQFLTEENHQLLEFHQEQVLKGQDMIVNNLKTLETTIDSLRKLADNTSEDSASAL